MEKGSEKTLKCSPDEAQRNPGSTERYESMDGHPMVLYRRNRVTGGTYFFTVTLRDRKSTVLVDRIDQLRAASRAIKRARPFRIDALVILPKHLDAIWTLPPRDENYSGRWRAIKAMFTRSLGANGQRMKRNPSG